MCTRSGFLHRWVVSFFFFFLRIAQAVVLYWAGLSAVMSSDHRQSTSMNKRAGADISLHWTMWSDDTWSHSPVQRLWSRERSKVMTCEQRALMSSGSQLTGHGTAAVPLFGFFVCCVQGREGKSSVVFFLSSLQTCALYNDIT